MSVEAGRKQCGQESRWAGGVGWWVGPQAGSDGGKDRQTQVGMCVEGWLGHADGEAGGGRGGKRPA